jgi:flagellar biosynthesis protein FliP
MQGAICTRRVYTLFVVTTLQMFPGALADVDAMYTSYTRISCVLPLLINFLKLEQRRQIFNSSIQAS